MRFCKESVKLLYKCEAQREEAEKCLEGAIVLFVFIVERSERIE